MERAWSFSRYLDTGAPVPGAEIRVFDAGTLNLSTIYDDDLSPIATLKANPFFADDNGYWFFYAQNGRYDVRISGGTPPIPLAYVLGDVNLGLGDAGPKPYDFAFQLPASPPSGHPIFHGHEGRIAYVRNDDGGIWVDTGILGGWQPVLGFGFPAVPFASLPTPGVQHRLRIVTDNVRGIWEDQGSYWFNIFGEVVNIQDFGAVGDGSNDDTAAIQAAIDALAATGGGGMVLIPARTFGITAPLRLRNGTRLVGTSAAGSVIKALGNFAGDSMVRGFSRDDNTVSNFETVVVEHLTLQGPAASVAPFYCLDLTGWHRSLVSQVVLLGGGTGTPNQTAIRVADRNPASTSTKDCLNNRLEGVNALFWNAFARILEFTALGVEDVTFENFSSLSRIGINFGGTQQGIGISFAGGLMYGDGISAAGAAVAITSPIPQFCKIDRLQVVAPFGDGDGALQDFRNTFFLNYPFGVGRSGTSEAAPLNPGGVAPGPFTGSVHVQIPAGTVLVPGRNVYTYTIPGMGALLPVSSSPIASCQGFIFNQMGAFGAANSGDTLFLVVVNTGAFAVNLALPCAFRVFTVV